MKTEATIDRDIETKIAELAKQGLGRERISKTLGISERLVRKVQAALKAQPAPTPTSIADPVRMNIFDTVPPEASFDERDSATSLTNWQSGWNREFRPPHVETETDRKGQVRTRQVTHDPGIVWPEGWTGPKSYDQCRIFAAPSRPKKWGLLITSAQQHTPVHGPALMALASLAAHRGLNFVAIGVEHAPQGAASKTDKIADWSSSIDAYVTTQRHDFESIVVDGAYPIKPTHETPLDGIAPYCKGRHHVFGSMRQDMVTLPRLKGEKQAFARATGAITVPNYSRSKSGMTAIINHVIGAVIVECDFEDRIFTRNVRCNPVTGELWDIDINITDGVVRDAADVREERRLKRPVLTIGCTHVKWINDSCVRAIWGIRGGYNGDVPVVDAVDPSEVILNDVYDGYSGSPHNRKNPFLQITKRISGDDDIWAELKLTADFLHQIESPRRNTWIVESNHHRHFDRALLEIDWKRDPKNASTLLRFNLAAVEAAEAGNTEFNVLEFALKAANPAARFFMSSFGTPLRFFKHYLHFHGDRGLNGGRGSNTTLKNLGMDIAAADNHAVEMHRQLVRLGNIIDEPPYAKGPNTWGHCFGIEHPDGNLQLVPIVEGKWRA